MWVRVGVRLRRVRAKGEFWNEVTTTIRAVKWTARRAISKRENKEGEPERSPCEILDLFHSSTLALLSLCLFRLTNSSTAGYMSRESPGKQQADG